MTPQVLSSGVAATMAVHRFGLRRATSKNLVTAWVLTRPAAMIIACSLYIILRQVFWDVMGTVIPPNANGLSWSRGFHGSEGRPDWTWLHFDLVNPQAHRIIETHPELPSFAKLLVCGTDESPQSITDGEVVVGVLPAYARTGDVDAFELTYWHFAMLPHCLITGRRRATRTLVRIWEAVENGSAPASPAKLIDLSIVEFAREVRTRLASLGTNLDTVEDKFRAPDIAQR